MGRRVADPDPHHEPVELRLRQRERPAKSCGFWVASTKKGYGSGVAVPSMDTCPSFIASSSADCVRGLARLISSASSTFAKIGPRRKTNSPSRWSKTLTPEDVARQEIARELNATQLAPHGLGESAGQRRLADAGHVLDEDVPAGEQRDERQLDRLWLSLEGLLDGRAPKLQEKRRSFTRDRER